MTTLEAGSSLYYSLLWTEESAKQRYLQRLQLIQALNSTLDDVQEPEVAEKKIHWWHEELQRMIDGEARHPSTVSAQEYASATDKACKDGETNRFHDACLAILSSASTMRFTPPSNLSDRETLLTENYRSRLALMCHSLSNEDADLDINTHLDIAALALAKHEQLIRLPSLLHRGHAVFSQDFYHTHSIQPADLAAHIRVSSSDDTELEKTPINGLAGIPVVEHKPGKETLLKAAIEDTHATFVKAVVNPSVAIRYRQNPLLPVWRIIVLRRKQLALWQKNQPDLLTENMKLTPISKFICAWRNRH